MANYDVPAHRDIRYKRKKIRIIYSPHFKGQEYNWLVIHNNSLNPILAEGYSRTVEGAVRDAKKAVDIWTDKMDGIRTRLMKSGHMKLKSPRKKTKIKRL